MPDLIISCSNSGTIFRKPLRLLLGAETHHPLDARAVVPAAVEDHDLARGRQVRQVALRVHLRLLALGRRGQRDHAKHPRAHALGDRLDRAALAGAVAPLEHDADLESLGHHPLLQLDQLDVQLLQLAVVVLAGELLARRLGFALVRPRLDGAALALLRLARGSVVRLAALLCHRHLHRIVGWNRS